MLIDWFTVVAQALNFLILIWLLKRYLYKPVLDAIDARERHIELELDGAAAKQAEALIERDALRNKNAAFDAQRAGLLAAATDQGMAERTRLLAEVRKEADDLRAQYAGMARAEEARLVRQIARLTQEEVFGMARKAFADLCDVQLEERMAGLFVRRLRSLEAETKNLLGAALRNSTEAAVLRSSAELAAEQRAAIQAALNQVFAAEVRLRFEARSDIVCGIELSVGGQKLAWSVADYLNTLEHKVEELLEPVVGAGAR
jgi:F-type H+-transporting ATPase subunit b